MQSVHAHNEAIATLPLLTRFVCRTHHELVSTPPHLWVRGRHVAEEQPVLVVASAGDPKRPPQIRIYPLTEPPPWGIPPALRVGPCDRVPPRSHIVAKQYDLCVFSVEADARERLAALIRLAGSQPEPSPTLLVEVKRQIRRVLDFCDPEGPNQHPARKFFGS